MKTKKLVLNKKTVAHLTRNDMNGALGGAETVYSCHISYGCLTVALCNSTAPGCECTDMCTMICPPTFP